MEIIVQSNIGLRRSSNQDYAECFQQHGQHLMVLCDGVGGGQAGDVASKMTAGFIGKKFRALEGPLDLESAKDFISKTIYQVNDHVFQQSEEQEKLNKMSTTLVLAYVLDEEILIAHVGDSRAYAYRQNHLEQLTEDHSYVNELIRSGEISEEEGKTHPKRNAVTESIGGTPWVSFEMVSILRNSLDLLMLCSDGLTNMLDYAEIMALFEQRTTYVTNADFVDALIQAANHAGGLDNITIILFDDTSDIYQGEVQA